MKHALVNRTSPKGTPFAGTCAACGKAGITFEMLPVDECENVRQMTQEQALLEAIEPRPDRRMQRAEKNQ
jgi:hypothetical protein